MIYELDVDGFDFLELIITEAEYLRLATKGIVKEYIGEERIINVYIRKENG